MATQTARMLGSMWRMAIALAAGVACGALLVSAYIYAALDDALVFDGLLEVALYYGAAIAAVCVPIWLMLVRMNWDGAPAAAALGFVATATFLVLTEAAGGHQRLDMMAYTFLPYALCGAIAAVVTWWVGRRLDPG